MQKCIKGVLNCCKLQVIFKSQNKLCNNFCFKDLVPQILTSSVVYKFQCGLCNESYCGECVRHLAVRSGKRIGISPLTLFRVGILGALTDVGGGRPSLPKICHRYCTMMKLGKVIPYLKKIKKKYESRDTPTEFCWHQQFSNGNQQILLYREIQIEITFWCISSKSFNFSWVFRCFCNKPGYNFDDVSKNGYLRSS